MENTLKFLLNMTAATLAAATGTFLAESLRKAKEAGNKREDKPGNTPGNTPDKMPGNMPEEQWEEPDHPAPEGGPSVSDSEDYSPLRTAHEKLGKALDLADEAYDKAEMYRRAYYSLKLAAYEKGIEIKDEVEEDDVYFDYGYLRDRMDLL